MSKRALEELERPVSGLGSDATSLTFYDLPLEQLCGQLAAAADLLLDEPGDMPALTVCLVGYQGAADMLELIEPTGDVEKKLDGDADSKGAGESKQAIDMLGASAAPRSADYDPAAEEVRAAAAAALRATETRAKLARAIQRRIDAFQIAAGGEWRRRLRSTVILISLIFSGVVTFSAMEWKGFATVLGYTIYGGLAGVLARPPLRFLLEA